MGGMDRLRNPPVDWLSSLERQWLDVHHVHHIHIYDSLQLSLSPHSILFDSLEKKITSLGTCL